MAQGEYTVRLEAFEGPLDLLLYLIRKAEVDVADIPVATIADQYLGSLSHVERVWTWSGLASFSSWPRRSWRSSRACSGLHPRGGTGG
ncbi:MAG: hypothetical protein M5U20_08790 [Phycisphaerales bacterium]|nr:hypothetical protein [Phycisphaerales bacterium]